MSTAKKKIKVKTVWGIELKKVDAEPISFDGFKEKFAIYGDSRRGYTVIELSTGLAVVTSHRPFSFKLSKKLCISQSTEKLMSNKAKWKSVLNRGKRYIKRMGIEYPVNKPPKISG